MPRNYYSEIHLHMTWHTKASLPLLTPKVEAIAHHCVRGKCINTPGVYVHEVAENSPAAKAGIQSGDILITADGAAVSGLDDLNRILVRHKFGDELAVRFIRKLDLMSATVKLEASEA